MVIVDSLIKTGQPEFNFPFQAETQAGQKTYFHSITSIQLAKWSNHNQDFDLSEGYVVSHPVQWEGDSDNP